MCIFGDINLVILNLENNGFIGAVPDSMGSLKLLDMISMRGNSFTGELPSSLRNFTYLRFLDLGENEFSGKIPEWLGESLSYLVVLSLPSNRFHVSIPTSLCKLQNMQILDLSLNNISGNIPKCLNNVSAMTVREKGYPRTSIEYATVGLERNRVPTKPRVIFKVLLQWKGRQAEYQKTLNLVVSLDISSNRLTGNIPDEITSLLALIALNLSRNSLTGPIPEDIGLLKQLDFLDISRNNLVGAIPTNLVQLSNLGVLDLSSNNLSGRIPKGKQLQSFNASSYAQNPALCGVPLLKLCHGDNPGSRNPDVVAVEESNDEKLISKELIFGIVGGFVFGFWGFYGTLVLKESWRHAYFGFLNVVMEWVLLRLELTFARLMRKNSP